ncbi:hypothetical protein F2P81_004971 [Scophthalmus maximus]|uniref:Uncharacterized protein n=1 Tax=Scophthalmus maximus TaxID=52904 RepID=A0A6A4TK84_SCOMX|nr:hypothetical protein F2P81_004971 [Scophthalmus maximus]
MKTFAVNLHFIAVTIEGFVATPRQSWRQWCEYKDNAVCVPGFDAEPSPIIPRDLYCGFLLTTLKVVDISNIQFHWYKMLLFVEESHTLTPLDCQKYQMSGNKMLPQNLYPHRHSRRPLPYESAVIIIISLIWCELPKQSKKHCVGSREREGEQVSKNNYKSALPGLIVYLRPKGSSTSFLDKALFVGAVRDRSLSIFQQQNITQLHRPSSRELQPNPGLNSVSDSAAALALSACQTRDIPFSPSLHSSSPPVLPVIVVAAGDIWTTVTVDTDNVGESLGQVFATDGGGGYG